MTRIGRLGSRSTQTPGRQREEDERQELAIVRSADDLEGLASSVMIATSGTARLDDLRPELADRLGRPELQEVAVAPEAAASARGYASSPVPGARSGAG